MTTNIVKDALNWIDIGGVVQDFKDIAYLIFTPASAKYLDYAEAANNALSNHNWISAANSCRATKNLTRDKRVYCVYHSLQVFSEAMIKNSLQRPDYDALRWRAIRIHIDLPKI